MYSSTVGFIFAILFSTVFSQISFHELNLNENYSANIIATRTGNDGLLQILLQVNTIGYVGFGFSHHPNMTQADLFIGGFDKDSNTFYGKDYYATANQMPIEDPASGQNWLLLGGEESNGTFLYLNRGFRTNDPEHDVYIENFDIYLLWSYGETDTISWHEGKRGSFLINLFPGGLPDPEISTTTSESTSGSGYGNRNIPFTNIASLVLCIVLFSQTKISYWMEKPAAKITLFYITL